MTPAPRRKTAVDGPGPVRLADAIDPPEDPRPAAKRGPTLSAGFGRPPEAPTPTPWPNAKQSNRRTLHLRQAKATQPNGKRSRRLPSWRTTQRHARLMTFITP